jgi:predicted Zn finger-like uncharacterized protein
MSDKQTRCPNCSTIYKVSVTQLTVAEGMVCCPKCDSEFNALLHLFFISKDKIDFSVDSSSNPIPNHQDEFEEPKTEQHILDIFDRKITNSNITLRTYLNNLNTFNHDPVASFPALNLSSNFQKVDNKPKTILYIASWTLINLLLVTILFFQILWFNPVFLDRSPFLNKLFMDACSIVNCETIDERYSHIKIENLKVLKKSSSLTEFKGELNNHYKKGLKLPLIKVTLYNQDKVVATYVKAPEEYLVESLSGITRIPQHSPYNFKISINSSKIRFDQHKLQVIRP